MTDHEIWNTSHDVIIAPFFNFRCKWKKSEVEKKFLKMTIIFKVK